MKKIILTCFVVLLGLSLSFAQELITDGSVEGLCGGGTDWAVSSTNFGTPACDLGSCGNGTGTGASDGTCWLWFGGAGGVFEEGSASQSVNASCAADATLSFDFESIICDSPSDYVEVLINGVVEWTSTGADATCGVLGYTNVSLTVPLVLGANTIEFHSETFGASGGGSNFFIDNVSLIEDCGAPPPAAVPTLGQWGIYILALFFMAFGVAFAFGRKTATIKA